MSVQVNQNSTPPSAASPDGSAAFPLNIAVAGGTVLAVTNPYPNGATPLSNSSGNQPAATATATLTSAAGRTAYLTGFEFLGGGVTTGSAVVSLTVTGVIGGPLTYPIMAPVGAAVPMAPLASEFNPPLQATGTNVNIAVSVPSLGAGNLVSGVVAHGYMV